METTSKQLPARAALRAVLDEGGPIAQTIRSEVDRSLLSRYIGGDRIPGEDTREVLHVATHGRVARDGWYSAEELRDRAARMARVVQSAHGRAA